MANLPRPPVGLPPRQNSTMRPPIIRPSNPRAQSSATTQHIRSQASAASPTNSVFSMSTLSSRSPSHQHGGRKRKERDSDNEAGEETNIHVVVRCRGRNDREVRENSGVVLSTNGVKGKSVELSMGPSALSNKIYHFDKVFSPAADQAMIYEDVVTPLLDEMLQGYNCTIFAYGQTGTGKTYTMSGDMSDTMGLLSDSAGIIPRVLHSLFNKLEGEEAESSVKCSFIELYNEELRDLLSLDDHTKLKIYDDPQKKGHSTTFVQGMEESHIKTAGAGIKLLQDGSYRRQVAATKCNDLSSRSHTVFTITVYTKRTEDIGEEYVSAGKLNLVDLAGSENIQRSGAENKRATEAGLINKSLLTLGRVINALVDRSSHIPYRESKLTRLLQDSLGGRTKTCIIATVSPAKSNLEETVSTLDYAFRAKNIRNKPQINQMISKKTLLREFTAEIEKLKGDLIAARQRNGVYLTSESYEEMTVESESRRILGEEQKAKIETMEVNLRNKVQELFSLTTNFATLKRDNEATKQALEASNEVLEKTELVLGNTKQNLADETVIRKAHETTEEQLISAGSNLISTLDRTIEDVNGLHAKISRKSNLQSLNRGNWHTIENEVFQITNSVESRVDEFQKSQTDLLQKMSTRLHQYINGEVSAVQSGQAFLQHTALSFEQAEEEIVSQTSTARNEMSEVLEEIKVLREDVKQKVGLGLEGLSAAAGRISAGVIKELEEFHTQLHTSYSSLGRDVKSTLEELSKQLVAQKNEADELRDQLSVATDALVQSNARTSEALEAALMEERIQAAEDQQTLLSKMTSLVNNASQKQNTRWSERISSACSGLATSQSEFQVLETKYGQSMDAWSQKESTLIEEVMKSRESLRSQMKRDWTAIGNRNSSIQMTTKSIHEETIGIVDAQMKGMAVQMQALDDFVTRARSRNDDHHDSHLQSIQRLSSSVSASQSDIGEQLRSAETRVREFDTNMSNDTSALRSSIPPLTTNLCDPLSSLRTKISQSPLTEYTSTGSTPQKTHYQYSTILPRTQPRSKLLLNANPSNGTLPDFLLPGDLPSISTKPPSPTKSKIYTDIPISDSASSSSSAPIQPIIDGPPGLREVDANIATLPRPSLKDDHSFPSSLSPCISANNAVEISFSSSLIGKGPPPLKRHATMESKLPGKGFGDSVGGRSKRVGSRAAAEGRENLRILGEGRRLRSSHSG